MVLFPDLKGQAPLRLSTVPEVRWFAYLFLTSKVRLHCDNDLVNKISGPLKASFPDLKGQAPLRLIFVEKM